VTTAILSLTSGASGNLADIEQSPGENSPVQPPVAVEKGHAMSAKLSREVLESYLNCKYKAHLKLAGQCGTPSDHQAMTVASRRALRTEAIGKLVTHFGLADASLGTPISIPVLKQAAPLLLNADLEDESLSLRFDGLKRVDGLSQLGDHHYIPLLHHESERVGQQQKVLLALYGLALGGVQGKQPDSGLVVHGSGCRLTKVRLNAKLYRRAADVLRDVRLLHAGGEPPRLTLNGHCRLCEFRQQCRTEAEKADDISLLEGVGEKELQRYHRKGLFTLTQLSCTFRPRKRGKRVKRPGSIHYSALQALAIREKKVYVYGTPSLPQKPLQVFFDAEGSADGSFAYLLGVIVVEGNTVTSYSFWADSMADEEQAFDAFLDLLAPHENFCLFHYGSYEKALLRRMRRVVRRKKLVDRALANAVNVLSIIHANVYFPTFSNGLKEIGKYLGCTWTEADASGLQSLVWRARWEQTGDQGWRRKLITYNAEDCSALKQVAEYLYVVGEAGRQRGEAAGNTPTSPAVAWADELATASSRREWGGPTFALAEFEYVNQCAYFDYQREKVFLRTSKAVRRACLRHRRLRKVKRLRPNRKIEIRCNTCPFCRGSDITRFSEKMHVKVAYDLKLTPGGVRRQVIHCTAALHQCKGCKKTFLPRRYKRRDKHFHALKCWAMYQHVVHRISLQNLESMFAECFGLRVGLQELHMMKSLMAARYRETWKRILARIVSGVVAHVDETHVNLQRGKGYVWVLTNLEDVVYLYKPSREGTFLPQLLDGFKGVLISDFFSAYDSLPCEQQKCLIHLMRDFNHDLLNHPYDEEFKALTAEFGKLLRSIVSTIDRYGLKNRHLHKHKADVARFYRALATRAYRSELAESYQKRLIKNEGKLFVFLDHDGVPWNNNNAEHAIRYFAYYRRISDGMLREGGLSDYLVLLSINQTCKYRGVSFLRFLLSGEQDIEAFCRRAGKKKRPRGLEVYPKGFPRMYRRKERQGLSDGGQESRAGIGPPP
jgi:predicted RecB family nuclease